MITTHGPNKQGISGFSLRQRLMVLVTLVTLIFLSAGVIWQNFEEQHIEDVVAESQQGRLGATQRLIQIFSNSLEAVVANGLNRPDLGRTRRLEKETEFLRSAKLAFAEKVWLLNETGATAQEAKINPSVELQLPPGFQDFAANVMLPTERRQFQYHDKTNGQTTIYVAAKAVDGRVMVAGRSLENSLRGELEEGLGIRISARAFAPPDNRFVIDRNGTTIYYIPLRNFDGSVTSSLTCMAQETWVERLFELISYVSAAFLIFCLLVMVAIGTFVVRAVVRPITAIGTAIIKDEPHHLDNVVKRNDELSQLARVAIDFIDQRHELVHLNEDLEVRVGERTKELTEAYDSIILGWSRAMDSRDKETEGHTQRVAEMAVKIGRAMGLDEDAIQILYRGALLHDIGKIGIPDSILLKPGKLTDEEMEVMKSHTLLAYEMLKPVKFLEESLCIPLCHHEKFDGTGYPLGLSADQIPLLARIFAVADVWDALRSDRPYRRSWSEQKTREHIIQQSGTHFDPIVVDAYLRIEPIPHPSDDLWNQIERDAA